MSYRNRRLLVLAVLAIALASVANCSTTASNSTLHAVAEGCTLNSDCAASLSCIFGKCHEQCHTTVDCKTGEHCVKTMAAMMTLPGVCQPPAEATMPCTYSTQCPSPLKCAVDSTCRAACIGGADCLGGQSCVSHVCADDSQIDTMTGDLAHINRAGGWNGVDDGDGGGVPDASASTTGGTTGGTTTTGSTTTTGGTTTGSTGRDGSVPDVANCDVYLPSGACDYCPSGACGAPNGHCVSGANDYSCECNGGYVGTGTKSCALANVCQANVGVCLAEYPCQPTASPGVACLGQYAAWPMPDAELDSNAVLIAKAKPSYSAVGGIVNDVVTGLSWQQESIADCSAPPDAGMEAGPASCTYPQAQAYCKNLTLGMHNDWRVPTRIEVESLFDCTLSAPPTINQAAFPNTPSGVFWSASTQVGNLQQMGPDFQYCRTNATFNPADSHLLRCVRGTGITASTAADHYTIHAAAIDAGTGDAGPEDTITDNWTGLTWERNFVSGLNFGQATARCATMGFRLPTFKELNTLVDPTRTNPTIDPRFLGTPDGNGFWSTTIVVTRGTRAYVVFTDGHSEGNANGSEAGQVRCVK